MNLWQRTTLLASWRRSSAAPLALFLVACGAAPTAGGYTGGDGEIVIDNDEREPEERREALERLDNEEVIGAIGTPIDITDGDLTEVYGVGETDSDTTYDSETTYDFEDDHVDGDFQRPDGARLEVGSGDSGFGAGDLTDRSATPARTALGRPQVSGQLDREIISRVAREHRREINYCYEAELLAEPSLAGQVSVNFTIASDGSVASVAIGESSLNSSIVESCISRRIRQWRFPEPNGGGVVNVSFPFDFAPGG